MKTLTLIAEVTSPRREIEVHQYLESEVAEDFTPDQIAALKRGETVEKVGRFNTVRWTDALAFYLTHKAA